MRTLSYILVALGAFGILISLPLLGFAVLGFLGVLADVSPGENREMGLQLLFLGLPPLIGGVILGAFGLLALMRKQRPVDAEPGAPTDGGA